ncbi:MAG: hypothetical protein HZB31_14840 [Nitrospirae bacterium]|nr:hypothetical protein [Nitrospirota bacterium]
MTRSKSAVSSTTTSNPGKGDCQSHRSGLTPRALLDWMGRLRWWMLLGVFAVLAEIATAAISAIQIWIWWRAPLFDLFLLGFVDAGLVSLIVGGAFVIVLDELRINERRARERQEELVNELRTASVTIKTLRGIIPICASCKKIRDDAGYWHMVEKYIQDHSDAQFSHGICPACVKKIYPEYYDKIPNNEEKE